MNHRYLSYGQALQPWHACGIRYSMPVLLPRRTIRKNTRPALNIRASAAAATWSFRDNGVVSYDARQAASAPAVAPLPAPPKSGESLAHVLPYLMKLAMSEKALSWRLGAAFLCMLVSKAAGKCYLHGVQTVLCVANSAAWMLQAHDDASSCWEGMHC